MHVTGKDRYSRTLGYIIVNGVNANEALLRNGLAWHYKHFNNDSKLDSLEQLAKKEKLNIWSQPNPVEPYQFRQAKKNQQKTSTNTSVKKQTSTSSVCGARTKNGGSCKRKVSGGGYCWQHAK